MTDLEELQAEYEYMHGNPTRLANWIRSGKPLSESTRESVALIIEGKYRKPRGRRPTDIRSKPISLLVRAAYDQVRERLRDEGEQDLHWATCEAIAKLWPGVTVSWVDKIIYRRNPPPKK